MKTISDFFVGEGMGGGRGEGMGKRNLNGF